MTPDQWANVARCAHLRWLAIIAKAPHAGIDHEGRDLAAGEWEGWMMAQSRTGRCPF